MLAEALGLSLTRRLAASGQPGIDFRAPMGEAALTPADSVSWRVFKNPVALFVGGIAAVLLELAEPRVRSGVWDHSSFRDEPVRRMSRTGLAAMVTVYGARSVATRMIAGVRRMHGGVEGVTPGGNAYQANDPELLDWVQATASFGFLEAYCVFVRPLSQSERDRFYAEGEAAAALYGASGAPRSAAQCQALFARMRPRLERSEIVLAFLDIVRRAPVLPPLLRPAQHMFIRAGVEIVPQDIRALLGLQDRGLAAWERLLVKSAGAAADRVPLPGPPADACVRLGLPADYLYR
jgi:uncharacterized protein (DUF2236 family)